MANRRMISSSLWEDEFIGEIDYFQRCLWIGLFSACADDQGRLLDNSILIRAKIFPYDDLSKKNIEDGIDVFEKYGKIIRYKKDGKKYIQILNWWEHQRPQWATRSKHPAPDGWTDRVRSRENGQYVEENWKESIEYEPQENYYSPERSPEQPSRDTQVARQYPVPVLVPDPIPGSKLSAKTADPSYEDCTPDGEPIREKKKKKPKDERSVSPAIVSFRRLTGLYPSKVNYEQVISVLGDHPDEAKMKRCYQDWCARGFKPTNINWLLDWYVNGAPIRGKPSGTLIGADAVKAELIRLDQEAKNG